MIIDGKKIADEIQEEIKSALLSSKYSRKPCLGVILVGENPASQIYIKHKTEACEKVGIISLKRELPSSTSEKELLDEIEKMNTNEAIDGILVQLPLPDHVNPNSAIHAIDPEKDVDGFHPINMGKLLIGDKEGFVPCTPLGIKVLLERSGVEVSGKHVVVLGRSNIVGKPVAALLMQRMPGGNATVSVVHSQSNNLKELCREADVLIAAIGQPLFVKADMVKDGVVIIDVGINKISNPERKSGYQIVGDVDFNQVKDKCALITPVPGGVGPMTIAMLLSNTFRSFQKRIVKKT
jgi:methylenetetrahydrofolate dehydrogenase (NADP+) / methenyltetrahydrofolate cyclohydrolase